METQKILAFADGSFRHDLEDFFKLSGWLDDDNKHSNLMAIEFVEGVPTLGFPRPAQNVLEMPEDTIVIARWPGKWRSDVFNFSLMQFRAWLETQDAKEE